MLGFAHTVGEFGVILMIGGNIPGRTRVMSTAIFDFVETMRWREANLFAGSMVAFAFVVILVDDPDREAVCPGPRMSDGKTIRAAFKGVFGHFRSTRASRRPPKA